MERSERSDRPDRPGERGFDPEPWRGELTTFVRRLGGGQDTADVVQEAFCRALSAQVPARPRAFLFRVALNVLRDRAKARRPRASSEPGAWLGSEPTPDEVALRRDLARAAWSIALDLPLRRRAALYLRIQRNMDYDELAIALGCTVPTARQHVHLAVKAVRDALARRERR